MGPAARPRSHDRIRVLIAGAGVAGLETTLALRALAGDLVDVELASPDAFFEYRPLSVGEPFDLARARRFDLAEIAAAAGAVYRRRLVTLVEPERRCVHTGDGDELGYDVLVLACGTQPFPALDGALTFRGPTDVDPLRSLLAEIDAGDVKQVAFVVPRRTVWALPLYELALMTGAHVEDAGVHGVELTLVTPEAFPFALLGRTAGGAVSRLLRERRIAFLGGRYPLTFEQGRLELVPEAALSADRVVALPRLEGRRILGVPYDRDGFVPVDGSGLVGGFDDVYAAGDVTSFPVKQGSIAAQQGMHVAEAIAARLGADVRPRRLEPLLHAVLLTGREPLYLRSELVPGRPPVTSLSDEPLFWPPAKLATQHLAPFLADLACAQAGTG